ncbi:hypothetical protein [Aliikangiella coralliicola]|uniref:Uncharacterized protein n=1 Tax=Aliikangiella coralliicola TaxID=2592383 RepID=A0A545UJX9_9GAMM|nr:hypothetical protein [Aliikangiella coralliicola]TQV89772.1 hypothetical protein FLL46_02510 [Aliikangiella coralliicola]
MRTQLTRNSMVKTSSVKKALLAIASLATVMGTSIFAKEYNFERAQKEIKIMSKIFETSLSEQTPTKRRYLSSRLQRAEATYLANQGMVFTFSFGRNSFSSADDWAAFGQGIGHFVEGIASEVGAAIAEVPVAPVAPDFPEFNIDFEDVYDGYQERREALEVLREKQQEQREHIREIQREIRSLERKKDRERDSGNRVEKLKDELAEKVDTLKQRMSEYNHSMNEYRKKRDEKYTASSKQRSDTIISTLCDYGATLRSLKNNEHVTLVFSNYADNKDQVYVFEYSDVKNCDSKEKLLRKAISYQL